MSIKHIVIPSESGGTALVSLRDLVERAQSSPMPIVVFRVDLDTGRIYPINVQKQLANAVEGVNPDLLILGRNREHIDVFNAVTSIGAGVVMTSTSNNVVTTQLPVTLHASFSDGFSPTKFRWTQLLGTKTAMIAKEEKPLLVFKRGGDYRFQCMASRGRRKELSEQIIISVHKKK